MFPSLLRGSDAETNPFSSKTLQRFQGQVAECSAPPWMVREAPLRVTCVPGELGAAGSAGKFCGCCHKGHSLFQRLQRHRNSGGSRQMLMPCCRSCKPSRLCGKLPFLYVPRSGDMEAECRTVLLVSSRKGGLGAPKCVFGDIGERCNKDIWNKVAEEIDRIHNSTRCCRPASIQLLLSRRNWRGS